TVAAVSLEAPERTAVPRVSGRFLELLRRRHHRGGRARGLGGKSGRAECQRKAQRGQDAETGRSEQGRTLRREEDTPSPQRSPPKEPGEDGGPGQQEGHHERGFHG